MQRCRQSSLWAVVAGLGLASITPATRAQTNALIDATPPSAAQSLACLERSAAAPQYPKTSRYDHRTGLMRVRLEFKQPDAAPSVEVLANTAAEDMQDQVFAYLKGYRLPCLKASDGSVAAVQEFEFSGMQPASRPLAEAPKREPLCVVMPRHKAPAIEELGIRTPSAPEITVLALAFAGDGQQAPEVQIIHSTGNKDLEEAAATYVKDYRMPCRKAGDEVNVVRQHFVYVPQRSRFYTPKKTDFALAEFLRLTQDFDTVQARFDFNTMSCPFQVRYTYYGPTLPNETKSEGSPNPNRALFLQWLSQRQLAVTTVAMERSLFGEKFTVHVPCGRLDLD
ncbi:hypothetical protein ACG0Z6_04595 [Roseateles sp. BYS180W]|uniref:TonB C-terminal domain-containing protein n=1 Tax=Roseateles rivi TaxID=3299028 RepID=A0ABW7FTC8_9BURK